LNVSSTKEDPALEDATPQLSSSSRKKNGPRHVRFAANVDMAPTIATHSTAIEEETQDSSLLWYSKEDLLRFKKQYNQDAKDVARRYKSKGNQAIWGLFHSCYYSFQDGNLDPDATVTHAAHYLQNPHYTGLERFVTRHVFRHKSSTRRHLWNAVFDIQQDASAYAYYNGMVATAQKEPDNISYLLHIACREQSHHVSVQFARDIATYGMSRS